MDKLPVEMLLGIFELVSYKDLKNVVLVCRRWREIGETPRLWSSFPVIVKTRNMSVMSEILSSRRMKQLEKLRIESTLSEEVSQTIMDHPVLRKFELSEENYTQTIISVLNVICSRSVEGTVLDMSGMSSRNNLSGVDPGLMAKAVTNLETLDIRASRLTSHQAAAVFTGVIEGSKMTELNIDWNDLSEVDPGLLAKVVTKLQKFYIKDTKLTQQQAAAILTAVSEGSRLTTLNISGNNLSGADPRLMAKAFNNLETLEISLTKLTPLQATAILTGVSEESKMAELKISWNDLSEVDPGLLAKAVTNLEVLNVAYTKLTQQKGVAILTAVSEGSRLTTLNISGNNLLGVDPGLMAKAFNNLETLDSRWQQY